MTPTADLSCIAFAGTRRIAAGPLARIAGAIKAAVEDEGAEPLHVLEAETSQPVELDLRGSVEAVLARLPLTASGADASEAAGVAPRGPGRPRLGVVAREVTLLPRHWEWLNAQPGGASVALRKLVEEARRAHAGRDRERAAQEACYRFMRTLAGDAPGFEEATRALYAKDLAGFLAQTRGWPRDVREHARALARRAIEGEAEAA